MLQLNFLTTCSLPVPPRTPYTLPYSLSSHATLATLVIWHLNLTVMEDGDNTACISTKICDHTLWLKILDTVKQSKSLRHGTIPSHPHFSQQYNKRWRSMWYCQFSKNWVFGYYNGRCSTQVYVTKTSHDIDQQWNMKDFPL